MNTQSLKYNNNTLVSLIILEQARHCNVAHTCFSPWVFFLSIISAKCQQAITGEASHSTEQQKPPHLFAEQETWWNVLHLEKNQISKNQSYSKKTLQFGNYFTHFVPLRLGEFPLPSNNITAHMSRQIEGKKWSLAWDYEGVIIILQSLFHSSKPVHFCFISGWALIFGTSLVTFIFILFITENMHKLGIIHKQKIHQ